MIYRSICTRQKQIGFYAYRLTEAGRYLAKELNGHQQVHRMGNRSTRHGKNLMGEW